MIHMKLLRSTVAHALIKHIDVEKARSMPGVPSVRT